MDGKMVEKGLIFINLHQIHRENSQLSVGAHVYMKKKVVYSYFSGV